MGRTPVAMKGHVAIVELLMEAGASINTVSEHLYR